MPPKKRAAKRKAVPKRKFIIQVKIEIPSEIIDEARAMPEKECNKHVQRYILDKHAIDVKNLSFAKPEEASSAAPAAKKGKASAAAALEAQSDEDVGDDDYYNN
jgi:hypothetical protein